MNNHSRWAIPFDLPTVTTVQIKGTELSFTELLSLAKDIAVAGAALTGAAVAVRGLSTWKRQMKGKADYELSRRILVRVLNYRDALNGVRNPFMSAEEMSVAAVSGSEQMNDTKKRYLGLVHAYQNRWTAVHEQRRELDADILETEATWGTDVKTLCKDLYKLERELLLCIRRYLDMANPDISEESRNAISRIDRNSRDIQYDTMEEDDEYRVELSLSIEKLKNYLRQKIKEYDI